jgi:hypothetical protein
VNDAKTTEVLERAKAYKKKEQDRAKQEKIQKLRDEIRKISKKQTEDLWEDFERGSKFNHKDWRSESVKAEKMLRIANLTEDRQDYRAALAVYTQLVEHAPTPVNFLGKAVSHYALHEIETAFQELIIVLQLPVPLSEFFKENSRMCIDLHLLIDNMKENLVQGVSNGSIDPGLINILRHNCKTDPVYSEQIKPLLPLFGSPLIPRKKPLIFSVDALDQDVKMMEIAESEKSQSEINFFKRSKKRHDE